MTQLQLLIAVSQTKYEEALNILWVVIEPDTPSTLSDKIYAYMVTKDWMARLVKSDPDKLLDQFKHLAQQYEQEFDKSRDELTDLMYELRSDSDSLCNDCPAWVQEMGKEYYRSLRVVADFFAKELNDHQFNCILDISNVPKLTDDTAAVLRRCHRDYSRVLEVLAQVQLHALPATVENIMYAYMIAKDWCKWATNPDDPTSPLYGKESDVSAMLTLFRGLADHFERVLEQEFVLVKEVMDGLAPNPSIFDKEGGSAEDKMYYRSLLVTAEFFYQKHQDADYMDMLYDKGVPTLNELELNM